jgi:predicted component of type VI protein secretion system
LGGSPLGLAASAFSFSAISAAISAAIASIAALSRSSFIALISPRKLGSSLSFMYPVKTRSGTA